MSWLLLAIACSVSVSVLLKLAGPLRLDIRQAIAVNYLVAAALAAVLLRPDLAVLGAAGALPWAILLLLGIALPGMFWVLALAVRRTGIVRTDAAMRLSLLLPLLAAFTLFGEPAGTRKLLGAALGLFAIALIVRRRVAGEPHWRRGQAGLLLLVFAGMGVIDILFKGVARLSPVSSTSVLLAAFLLAALAALAANGVLYRRGAARWAWRHVAAGLVLGGLNFGNIVAYVAAHRALPDSPAAVFAGMNIGVIVLATLLGVGLFRESLQRANQVGLALAVLAVWLLAGG